MGSRHRVTPAGDDHYAEASAAGKARRRRGDFAILAVYDATRKRLRVELASGVVLQIPVAMVQGLSKAPARDIKSVELTGRGSSLHWPALDLDLSVPQLLAGSLGSDTWMRTLASHAGKRRSRAKTLAARENGKKGGRPRKTAPGSPALRSST
jgi:hypothetical protein